MNGIGKEWVPSYEADTIEIPFLRLCTYVRLVDDAFYFYR